MSRHTPDPGASTRRRPPARAHHGPTTRRRDILPAWLRCWSSSSQRSSCWVSSCRSPTRGGDGRRSPRRSHPSWPARSAGTGCATGDPARRPSPLVGTGRRTTPPSVAGGARRTPGAWGPGGVHPRDRDAPGARGEHVRRLRGRRARPEGVTCTRWASAPRDGTSRTAGRRPGRRSVEVMGFEPTASSMRPKRSSQLSYTPTGTAHRSAPSRRSRHRLRAARPARWPAGAAAGGRSS